LTLQFILLSFVTLLENIGFILFPVNGDDARFLSPGGTILLAFTLSINDLSAIDKS
jgi:uncharacterized PurR-regulated membrane protein YhhQ (DUF165 family)